MGTGALRRIAQLHALGLQLEVTPIRGNVDTRLARVLGRTADLDAIVLARAGLARLGRADEITETLDPMLMLPAPAQGALAVECRVDDRTWSSCSPRSTTHRPAPRSPRNGRCWPPWRPGAAPRSPPMPNSPKATTGDEIYLRGAVISPDGTRALRLSRTGTPADAAEIGKALAAELLDLGADSILGHEGHTGPGTQQFGSTE